MRDIRCPNGKDVSSRHTTDRSIPGLVDSPISSLPLTHDLAKRKKNISYYCYLHCRVGMVNFILTRVIFRHARGVNKLLILSKVGLVCIG